MTPALQLLFETPGLPQFDLPAELATLYGGKIGFSTPCLYANFVQSLDGVTAIPGLPQSGRLIAGGSEPDRFVMGLLRACADAVLIGAGTLHGSPHTHWTAENAYPSAATLYAELRRRCGAPAKPALAVLTGSGSIDPQHPGLSEPALVLTSEEGAKRLEGRLPAPAAIVPIADRPPLAAVSAVDALHARGYARILCEGGPTLFGALMESRLVDELFLTLSPQFAGRKADSRRLSLIENAELLPALSVTGRLLSARRAQSHLFMRYDLQRV